VLYLLAWSNVLAAGLTMSSVQSSALDMWLASYPALQGAHLLAEIAHLGGPAAFLQSANEPSKTTQRRCTFVLVVLGALGALTLPTGWDKSRPLMVCTALLVIPRSRYFASMFHLLALSILECLPYIGMMLIVMMLFAQGFHDLYGHAKAHNVSYFSSFHESLRTMFQLFTGQSWHNIMLEVAHETSEAAKFVFMAYVFCSTLLFGQLVLGIIISVYDEIVTFTSTAIYTTLAPLYRHLSTKERSRIISDFLTINCMLSDIHNKIQFLEEEESSTGMGWRAMLKQQLEEAVEKNMGMWDSDSNSEDELEEAYLEAQEARRRHNVMTINEHADQVL